MADFNIPSTLISGAAPATSYDLPQYYGELFDLMPQITPFFSAIGGENGGRSVKSRDFIWEVEDGEAAGSDQQQFENASVTGDLVPRQPVSNVVEIHQEAVKIGYTAQAVMDQLGTAAHSTTTGVVAEGSNPVTDPMQHQINKKINKIRRDLEMSFLNGTYAQGSADNTVTKRATRGLVSAITTHVVGYTAGLYTSIKAALNDLLLDMDAPALEANSAVFGDPVIIVNPKTRLVISDEYSNSGALAERSRTVGGVAIDTLVTDFGTFGLMSDRYLPNTELLVTDLSVCRPVLLEHPENGVFFVEPLAKTGAFDAVQIYGEIGLEYGPETYHGKINTITY